MARLSADTIAQSRAALQAGDLQAALAIRNHEYHQESGSFDDISVQIMGYILRRTPALLADCPRQILEPLRVGAAMMELWGRNTIRDFVTIEKEPDYRFGIDAIAAMLWSHGSFLRSLDDFRRVGILRVKLLGSRDSDICEACRAADGRKFTIDTVPELPLASCTCEDRYGCKIIVTADVEFYDSAA